MLQACEEFKAISRKLYDKPNCVEELAEMREWMKTIPDKLKEHQVRKGSEPLCHRSSQRECTFFFYIGH